MALMRKKLSEIPPDAVLLTEEEALRYQTNILKNWSNQRDIFAFKYGSYILGGASFLTGLYINNYYRNKFHLYYYGRVASYLPICVIPAAISIVTHTELVLKNTVLQRRSCPVCLETRASALQSFIGCVFPLLLGISSTLSLAQKYATYDIPYITQEPKKVFKLIQATTKPISNLMFAVFIGQALLASVVTYFELKSVDTVNMKLAILEAELESKGKID